MEWNPRIAALGVALATLVVVPSLALAGHDDDNDDDDDDDDHEEHHSPRVTPPVVTAASAATAAVYASECGSCHVAYPPALLPARSWSAILAGLTHHYGDDAGLPPERTAELASWLRANAGDAVGSSRTARISAQTTPDRITTLGWFVHEHGELPASFVTGNAEVRSFANCGACHPSAAQGRFSEHEIRIPGRSWSDD